MGEDAIIGEDSGESGVYRGRWGVEGFTGRAPMNGKPIFSILEKAEGSWDSAMGSKAVRSTLLLVAGRSAWQGDRVIIICFRSSRDNRCNASSSSF